MTLKTKKELIAALKAKSLPTTKVDPKAEADAKAKEEADKKAKEEADAAAKAKADEEAKACADKPKEEVKKEDPAAPGQVSLESLSAKIDEMAKNMNMVMEALSVVLEGNQEAPAEEAKEDPKKDPAHADAENVVEDSTETADDEKTEDELLKELEKTIAEIDELEEA